MQIYIKNNSNADITVEGQIITPSSYYMIQPTEQLRYGSSSQLLGYITDTTCIIAKSDTGSDDITDVNTAIDFLKGALPTSVSSTNTPFASKVLPDGSKLFERKHGVAGSSVAAGTSVSTVYTITYTNCKITAVEVIGGNENDQVDFEILDTVTGTVTTIPSALLNQFGFGVFITAGKYKEESRYDADLFVGLQLRMTYTNNSNSAVTPNFNVTLHEVKS